MHWIPLHNTYQIRQIIFDSNQAEVLGILLFKHSTRCSISDMAMSRFERKWGFTEREVPAYYLDILANRTLSGEIAAGFNVEHQSPQVLFIQKGICVFSQSHNAISVSDLQDHIRGNG